jgi:hypothetical protein
MYIHTCRCFQEHLRMLLQNLKAYCTAPGEARKIMKNSEALVRDNGVSGRFAYIVQTIFNVADDDEDWPQF